MQTYEIGNKAMRNKKWTNKTRFAKRMLFMTLCTTRTSVRRPRVGIIERFEAIFGRVHRSYYDAKVPHQCKEKVVREHILDSLFLS